MSPTLSLHNAPFCWVMLCRHRHTTDRLRHIPTAMATASKRAQQRGAWFVWPSDSLGPIPASELCCHAGDVALSREFLLPSLFPSLRPSARAAGFSWPLPAPPIGPCRKEGGKQRTARTHGRRRGRHKQSAPLPLPQTAQDAPFGPCAASVCALSNLEKRLSRQLQSRKRVPLGAVRSAGEEAETLACVTCCVMAAVCCSFEWGRRSARGEAARGILKLAADVRADVPLCGLTSRPP
jgi:cbb3-type cytochrome oxidase subunit 3